MENIARCCRHTLLSKAVCQIKNEVSNHNPESILLLYTSFNTPSLFCLDLDGGSTIYQLQHVQGGHDYKQDIQNSSKCKAQIIRSITQKNNKKTASLNDLEYFSDIALVFIILQHCSVLD